MRKRASEKDEYIAQLARDREDLKVSILHCIVSKINICFRKTFLSAVFALVYCSKFDQVGFFKMIIHHVWTKSLIKSETNLLLQPIF